MDASDTLAELEATRRDLTAIMLELDTIIGEVRLRLRGLEEAARIADAVEHDRLPAGWKVVDGEIRYSAAWLNGVAS